MPPQKHAVTGPNAPHQIPDEATLDFLIESGYLLCGNPDEVNEQIEKYQSVGCDQLVFGIPNEGFEHDEVLEMIELFGTKVIPNFDTDPVHSTTRYRETAERKHPDFAQPAAGGSRRRGHPHERPAPAGGLRRHPTGATGHQGAAARRGGAALRPRSVAGVTTREIVEAAGQRNTSAVSYHFGSREGLLLEVLARRGGADRRPPRGAARRARRPADSPSWSVPGRAVLRDAGRRAGSRLRADRRSAPWALRRLAGPVRHGDHGAPGLRSSTRSRPARASTVLRQERVVALIMVLTATTAERARRIDERAALS